MPYFRLVSNSSDFLSVEFHGENVGSAFSAAKRFCFDDAQVWQDGCYLSTLKRLGPNRDFWSVSHEELAPEPGGLQPSQPVVVAQSKPHPDFELAA